MLPNPLEDAQKLRRHLQPHLCLEEARHAIVDYLESRVVPGARLSPEQANAAVCTFHVAVMVEMPPHLPGVSRKECKRNVDTLMDVHRQRCENRSR